MNQSVIKTAGRVFDVLEYMREVRRPITVREIAEHFQYPLSSIQVLLKSISTLGYLRYDNKKRTYVATPRLAALGEWVAESMAASGISFEVLEQLARDTGLTAILAVENDIYVQYTHVVMGSGRKRFQVQPGTRRLLCMSGLGWALLAPHQDDYIDRMIQRTNSRLTAGGQQVQPEEVWRHVRETRAKGYAFSHSVVTPDVGILALTTVQDSVNTTFGLGLGGLLADLEKDEAALVQTLRDIVMPLGEI